MHFTRRFATLVGALAVCAALGLARPAEAQRALTQEIVESANLTQGDRDRIRTHVESNRSGLTGDETAIRRARTELVEPMISGRPSVAFRIEYSRALEPVLQPLITDSRDIVAANALQVLGELATPGSTSLLVRGLSDPRPSVRYAAAFGYQRLFWNLKHATPALSQNDAVVAWARSAGSGTEADLYVLEGTSGSLSRRR